MPTYAPNISPEVVQQQLGRILSSTGFNRNERLCLFLRSIVERELQGRRTELKESVLAVEVFGRKAGYDPKQDSIVRTEAAKLRDRLSNYYLTEGAADAILIEMPKGGYVPTFRYTEIRAVPVQGKSFPQGARPHLYILAAALALVVIAVSGSHGLRRPERTIPVAVLPLRSVSSDVSHGYYADGLTSEIIRNLTTIGGLAVRSQTSSFAIRDQPRNIKEVGEQLGVDYVLEGSVLHSSEHVRVNVQFVRVRDDLALWSGQFDREIRGDFLIQDEIAQGIVNSLRLTLGRGYRRYEMSPEAYELYLRARALPIRRGPQGFDESIGMLEQAIAKDPSFAPAYAGLAAAHAARSNRFKYDTPEEVSKMQAAAEQAIRLDPLLAEAHSVIGIAHARHAEWKEAEKSFRRALELEPSRSMSHFDYAIYALTPRDRMQEALHQLQEAQEADPLSNQVHFQLGWLLTSLGRYDEAVAHCSRMTGDHPEKNRCVGRAFLFQGRTEEAIAQFLKGDPVTYRANLAYAYARAGRRDQAEKVATNLSPMQQALVFAGFGDKERTIAALQEMATIGPVRTGWVLGTSEFTFVRRDPRITELRRNVGLPD